MPKKRVIGIRIHGAEGLRPSLLLEQLRYAGSMGRVGSSDTPIEVVLLPKGDINPQGWLETNLDRMRSFGLRVEAVER